VIATGGRVLAEAPSVGDGVIDGETDDVPGGLTAGDRVTPGPGRFAPFAAQVAVPPATASTATPAVTI
jgi:hypothetical protein